jgi:hypothetical protein
MFRKVGVFIFVLMLSMIGQTAFAGHWLLPAEAITVTGEVSNQRWVEDDGTYAADCALWLDPEDTGVLTCYMFTKDGFMCADVHDKYEGINKLGQVLDKDGSVRKLIRPVGTTKINDGGYNVNLPANWENNFCYRLWNGNLSVFFYPMTRNTFNDKLRSSVFETMFMILKFNDKAGIEKERQLGMVDNLTVLGTKDGKYYACGFRTDTAIGLFPKEQRHLISDMQDSLDKSKLMPDLDK